MSKTNFTLTPSLEHLALVKTAAILWNQLNIGGFVVYDKYQDSEDWQMIEKKIIEKVPQLAIPTCLKEKILNSIHTVGLYILIWQEFNVISSHLHLDLPSEFYWTPQGTVDKKKMVEVLIKDESIDITERFKLACIYCLEEHILVLWSKVPEMHRELIFVDEYNLQIKLLIFWKHYIEAEGMTRASRKKLKRECVSYEEMLQFAADSGNKVATEYFLQKLAPTRETLGKTALHVAVKCGKNITIGRGSFRKNYDYIPTEYYNEVFCFLLSQMNDEQQKELFKSSSFNVLLIFLEWPLQSLFVETANHLLNFLSGMQYWALLTEIVKKRNIYHTTCDYQEILHECLLRIPHAYKNDFINYNYLVFRELILQFNDKDKEAIKLLFQGVMFVERKKFIFSFSGQYICKILIIYDKWDLFKIFIQLCISSKKDMIRFKQEFHEYFHEVRISEFQDKWKHVCQFFDDFIREYDKIQNADESDN